MAVKTECVCVCFIIHIWLVIINKVWERVRVNGEGKLRGNRKMEMAGHPMFVYFCRRMLPQWCETVRRSMQRQNRARWNTAVGWPRYSQNCRICTRNRNNLPRLGSCWKIFCFTMWQWWSQWQRLYLFYLHSCGQNTVEKQFKVKTYTPCKIYAQYKENSLSLCLCLYLSLSLSLSLRFNGHFSDEPGLAGVYWSKV